MIAFPPTGLYAVTPESLSGDKLVERVAGALTGGARVVQYRDKSSDSEQRRRDAERLLELCQRHGAPLVINDDVALARQIGADGIHVGKDDADIEVARHELGDDAIIGVSCYNQIRLALDAQAAGASYIAFGSFFPSLTKPGAVRATTELVAEARASIHIPIVGIGGITAENAPALLAAGVDSLAVVNAVFGHDPEKGAAAFATLFD